MPMISDDGVPTQRRRFVAQQRARVFVVATRRRRELTRGVLDSSTVIRTVAA